MLLHFFDVIIIPSPVKIKRIFTNSGVYYHYANKRCCKTVL
jgi:hypothetical protein